MFFLPFSSSFLCWAVICTCASESVAKRCVQENRSSTFLCLTLSLSWSAAINSFFYLLYLPPLLLLATYTPSTFSWQCFSAFFRCRFPSDRRRLAPYLCPCPLLTCVLLLTRSLASVHLPYSFSYVVCLSPRHTHTYSTDSLTLTLAVPPITLLGAMRK